jgi:hypothetical protein
MLTNLRLHSKTNFTGRPRVLKTRIFLTKIIRICSIYIWYISSSFFFTFSKHPGVGEMPGLPTPADTYAPSNQIINTFINSKIAQDTVQWRALVNNVMNLQIHKRREVSLPTEWLLRFSRILFHGVALLVNTNIETGVENGGRRGWTGVEAVCYFKFSHIF